MSTELNTIPTLLKIVLALNSAGLEHDLSTTEKTPEQDLGGS